ALQYLAEQEASVDRLLAEFLAPPIEAPPLVKSQLMARIECCQQSPVQGRPIGVLPCVNAGAHHLRTSSDPFSSRFSSLPWRPAAPRPFRRRRTTMTTTPARRTRTPSS